LDISQISLVFPGNALFPWVVALWVIITHYFLLQEWLGRSNGVNVSSESGFHVTCSLFFPDDEVWKIIPALVSF
jgi:hypothetical protein